MFLELPKPFVKVGNKGPIFKLQGNIISGNPLSAITKFLKLRKQRVALNDELSS